MKTRMPEAKFIGSWPDVKIMPETGLPEFAFIGRSNVGKSSLINMLCGRKNLAHISSTPGKTQTVNLYNIDNLWMLADLPGYGYAKVSKSLREVFDQMVRNYFLNRPNLFCALVLIDSRIPPQKNDLDFIRWLGDQEVPVVIVYTKADKNKPLILQNNIEAIRAALKQDWENLPQEFITSATEGTGKDELLNFLENAARSV